MDHGLSDAAVGTSDPDIFIGTAKAALDMSLEMGQGQHGIIVQQPLAHRHLRKPFPALYREHGGPLRVQDIHRAEGPAVHL